MGCRGGFARDVVAEFERGDRPMVLGAKFAHLDGTEATNTIMLDEEARILPGLAGTGRFRSVRDGGKTDIRRA